MAFDKRGTSRVYQFKVVLDGIQPLIWRRIQVAEAYSFWDLHVAIQDAMGWEDYHLHRFEISDPRTGVRATIVSFATENSEWKKNLLSGWNVKISNYFTMANNKAQYVYDYLYDNWNHTLTLEGIFLKNEGIRYPTCLDGRRACPPEDCGGVKGYYELLKFIKNKKHHKFKETLNFTGGVYDPERLNIRKIQFDNPDIRLDLAFNR
jgi:hypothetical protein